jgi:enoyl-CoA hydratase/carnithine racemase
MDDAVSYSLEGGIAELRLNRPAKKNALTRAMYTALADGLDAAAADRAARVVLITAQGEAFTAGNDLADFLERPPTETNSPVHRFMHAIHAAEKPVVAAVNGVAVGIGVTLLLHCDYVLASQTARFQTPFVNLGLVPEAGSSLLLPHVIGARRAAEMVLLGEMLDAQTAREFGLVNRVVAPDALAEAAREVAAKLAAKPPEALQLSKRLLRPPPEAVTGRIAEENALFGQRLASPEAREAFQAFFEKRAPDFSRLG